MDAQHNNECNFIIRNSYRHTDHIDECTHRPLAAIVAATEIQRLPDRAQP